MFKKIIENFFQTKFQTKSRGGFFSDVFDSKSRPGTLTPFNSRGYLNSYEIISYVGKCISIIANDIAGLKTEIKDSKGNDIDVKEFDKLISNLGGGIDNFFEFKSTLITHLLLDGNAFIYKDVKSQYGRVKGVPEDLIILNPSLTDIYAGGRIITSREICVHRKIDRYESQIDMQRISIEKENVIHIKLANPYNQIRGIGLIQTNGTILDSDRLQKALNDAFLNNGMKSDYIFTSEQEIGSVERKRFEDQFMDKHSGFMNFFKPIIAPFGFKAQKLNITHEELEAVELKKITRSDISQFIFSIPAIRLGFSNESRLNTATQELTMYYGTTLPTYYNPLQSAINNIVKLFDKNATFKFVEKVIKDPDLESKMASLAWNDGIISGNEYRKLLSQDTIDNNQHLNSFYIATNKIQVENNTSLKKSKTLNADIMFHQKATDTKIKAEKNMAIATKKLYQQMEQEVILNFDNNFKNVTKYSRKDIDENLFNFVAMQKTAETLMRNAYTSIIVKAINDVKEFYGAKTDTTFKNDKIRLVVDVLQKDYQDDVLNNRKNELHKLLLDGLNEGKSQNELRYELQDYFSTLNGESFWRADRIARTEVSKAYDQASMISYQDLGIERVKVVGCSQLETGSYCDHDGSKGSYPTSMIPAFVFHPNHIGTIVPVIDNPIIL